MLTITKFIWSSTQLRHGPQYIAAGLEACLSDISDWMTTNILKINQDEIELIIFSPKNKPGCISRLNYKFDDQITKASSSVLLVWMTRMFDFKTIFLQTS